MKNETDNIIDIEKYSDRFIEPKLENIISNVGKSA